MKQIFLSICFVLSMLTSFTQQPPNEGFEWWSGSEPASWHTTNFSVFSVPFVSVLKDNVDPHGGNYSAQLKVMTVSIPTIGSVSIPGTLTTATIDIDPFAQTVDIYGGYPFSGTPEKLTGYFRYLPIGTDTCYMGWQLYKTTDGISDTIAMGYMDTSAVVNDWTYFEIPLVYDTVLTPDTMNILFTATNPNTAALHSGTKMWVDDLAFVYGFIAIHGVTSASGINIYADKDTRELIIDPKATVVPDAGISVYDMAGRLMISKECTLNHSAERLSLQNLSPGTYVVAILSRGKIIETKKIVVLR